MRSCRHIKQYSRARIVCLIFTVLIACPFFLAATPDKSDAENTLNVMSSRLQLLNLRLKAASLSPNVISQELTPPSSGKESETSAEVKIPLSDTLKAFFCLQEDNTGDLVSDENNQNFRAVLGINIPL